MRRFVLLLAAALAANAQAKDPEWSLASPNGACRITVALNGNGTPTFAVAHKGKTALEKSPLGLRRADDDFRRGLSCVNAGSPQSRWENYELLTGPKAQVRSEVNRRTLVLQNANRAQLIIDLAATDEGVAFRYRFPGNSTNLCIVEEEATGFQVPMTSHGFLQPYHAAGPYTPAYEDFYFEAAPGDPPPHSRGKPLGWAFPALFQVPQARSWMLITESGTDASYCGCHLDRDSDGGLYRIAFPAQDEFTKGYTNQLSSHPRFTLPWTMPWRVIVLGATAGDIALSTLVTDLAPPSRIPDASWIKPGRASWSWWSYPDGPHSLDRFNQFTDFAATMGWEYTLFDAGWWEPGLKPLSAHARERGVSPLAWCFASDFYSPARRASKLDEVLSAGACGVKVDFWCSDRQEAMAAMNGLFEAAAERRMLVNLHGCTLPRGWQRTWPNFLTAEAVLGGESYMYESSYTERAAELNTILPFTRNAIGPMDYTPVACADKKYPRKTTAAHELATALVFTSGIIHYAERPEFFASLPAAALQVFRDAPARWDESRCLIGEPGKAAVFARRSGDTWYIAGLNGTAKSRAIELDLRDFKTFSDRVLIFEGEDAHSTVDSRSVPAKSKWSHTMPSRGGFILRLRKQ